MFDIIQGGVREGKWAESKVGVQVNLHSDDSGCSMFHHDDVTCRKFGY